MRRARYLLNLHPPGAGAARRRAAGCVAGQGIHHHRYHPHPARQARPLWRTPDRGGHRPAHRRGHSARQPGAQRGGVV